MNEKRFTLDDEENGLCRCILVDGEEIPTCEICDLLNEQQAIINKFREKELYVQDTLRFYYSQIEQKKAENSNIRKKKMLLEEENDILKQKLRKNYIANKQYEEMKRLQKENEQLKEEIDELKQKEEVLNKIWRTYLENHK